MAAVLIIELPSSANDGADPVWSLVRDEAVIASGVMADGQPIDLPQIASPDRAIVLLPSEDAFIRRAPVPGQSERDARRAAPFLLEDHLAQSPDEVDVYIGPTGADGARWIIAIDRELRLKWRNSLSGLAIKPLIALPDGMALRSHGGDLTVMGYGDRAVFQSASGDLHGEAAPTPRDLDAALSDPVCGAVETALIGPVLAGLGQRLRPRRLLVSEDVSPASVAIDDTPLAVKTIQSPDLRIAAATAPLDRLAELPPVFGDAFAVTIDWGTLLKPWRTAAILGAAAMVSLAALSVGQALYLDQRAELYRAAQVDAYRDAFPEARTVSAGTVGGQMRNALRRVQPAAHSGAGFLELSAALANIVEGQDQVRIDALRYDASRGELSVTALYTGFGDFEMLRTRAETQGVVLEDGGARQSAQGVAAEFTVRLP